MPMKVLHVIPSLDYSSAVMQLLVLARGLPTDAIEGHVCVLGREGRCASPLRAAGATVEALGWRRWFDPAPLWQLRRRVQRLRPHVIHAWGLSALRAAALAKGRTSGRLLVSKPLAPRRRLSRLTRWLLGRTDLIVATGSAEAERCRRLQLGDRIVVVPPAVEDARSWAPQEKSALPAGLSYFVLCTGPLEPHKGFRDAIWGFDILRYVYPDLNLLVIGTGSDRPRLERFTRTARLEERVHFLGDRADVPALLGRAELVWVPSRAEGGMTFALEGMAAGRPVLASGLPGLAEVVSAGETGILVPPGDKVALVRETRRLLEDTERGRAMGAAGRRRVRDHFAPGDLVRRFAALYDDLAA
jgi:glycosyltransferase involved in cell wall biosynthesis